MVPNCEGCKYELEEAYEMQQKGYSIATTKGGIGLGQKGHLFILVVNDKGELAIG